MEEFWQKLAPFFANGFLWTCWGCGKPFVIRHGNAQAIVGPDDRLYCYRGGCEELGLMAHVLKPESHARQAALR